VTDDTQFKLGTHEGRLDSMDNRLESIEGKVDRLVSMAEQSTGAGKATARIAAGIGAFFGMLAGLAVEYFRK
jgi:tetrahydromethanopterin S-methyltransferase subunit G